MTVQTVHNRPQVWHEDQRHPCSGSPPHNPQYATLCQNTAALGNSSSHAPGAARSPPMLRGSPSSPCYLAIVARGLIERLRSQVVPLCRTMAVAPPPATVQLDSSLD